MGSRATMTWEEREIYNEAQALYQKAKARRDEAYKMQDERLREEAIRKAEFDRQRAETTRLAREVKKATDEAIQAQEFGAKIKSLCMALGEAVKSEGLTIDGGLIADPHWMTPPDKHIMTVFSTTFPRHKAEIYAVANTGFRWDISKA